MDETGEQKHGSATAGVKRQYMGYAGRVANGTHAILAEQTEHEAWFHEFLGTARRPAPIAVFAADRRT